MEEINVNAIVDETNKYCDVEKKDFTPTPEDEIAALKKELKFEQDRSRDAYSKLNDADVELKVLTKMLGKLQRELEDSRESNHYINKTNSAYMEAMDRIYYACKAVINFEDKPKRKELKDFAKKILGYIREV